MLFIEVANALATKSRISVPNIRKSLQFLFKADLGIATQLNIDILTAAKLAKKYEESVYDMLYATIAKRLKITLITADEKFKAKTKFRHVKLLSECHP